MQSLSIILPTSIAAWKWIFSWPGCLAPIILLAWLLYMNCPDTDLGDTSISCVFIGDSCFLSLKFCLGNLKKTTLFSNVDQKSPKTMNESWFCNLKKHCKLQQLDSVQFLHRSDRSLSKSLKNLPVGKKLFAASLIFSESKSSHQP